MIIPNQYVKQWTEGAIFCYKRGCTCEGCFYQELLSEKCKMKSAVFMLVKKLGAPKEYHNVAYSNQQIKVIEAILNGASTKDEISDAVGISVRNLQSHINKLYAIAKAEGCRFNNPRNMLPDYVEWVRKEKQ